MERGIDGISSKIRQNSNLDVYEKKVLDDVFRELYSMQEDVFKRMEAAVMHELQRQTIDDEVWDIVTALIEKDQAVDAKKRGFYEMLCIDANAEQMDSEQLEKIDERQSMKGEGIHMSAGIAFLDCAYSQIDAYCSNVYQAVITTSHGEQMAPYYLVFWEAYLHREEILERTAMQYGVNRPPLYSPMARRAVLVMLDLSGCRMTDGQKFTVDFKHQENGLYGVLLTKRTLVWNVEVIDKEQMQRPKENVKKKIMPLFQKMYRIYDFNTEKNEFIFVQSDYTEQKRYENTIYVGMHKMYDIHSIRYTMIRIHHAAVKNQEMAFTNFYCLEGMQKERVRTEADICYIMHRFEDGPLKYVGCGCGEKCLPVEMYDKKKAYHYPKSEKLRSSALCDLRFQKSQDHFFADRVNYVMAYMNYFYPEFQWVAQTVFH